LEPLTPVRVWAGLYFIQKSNFVSNFVAIMKRIAAKTAKTAISNITNSVIVPKIPARIISTRYVNGLR